MGKTGIGEDSIEKSVNRPTKLICISFAIHLVLHLVFGFILGLLESAVQQQIWRAKDSVGAVADADSCRRKH